MITDSYLFIHIPRTAGRSVLSVLGQPFRCQHRTIQDYCRDYGTDQVLARFKFATVRNPWERAVSWFAFFAPMSPSTRALSFKDWLAKKLNQKRTLHTSAAMKFQLNQFSYLTLCDGQVSIDQILRFERLQEDWPPVADRLKVASTLPVIGSGDRKSSLRSYFGLPQVPDDWRELYDSQLLIDMVGEMDYEVISRFHYVFQ